MSAPIEAVDVVLDRLSQELADAPATTATQFAPVLTLPRIFERELCEALVEFYRAGGSTASGFTKDIGGQTVQQIDPLIKRRHDVFLHDEGIIEGLATRLRARLFPMVKRALGWQAQHIERYLVCRYGAEEQGFFFAHRDDVTAGSAHRKFAVTLNLNDDFDGGEFKVSPSSARAPIARRWAGRRCSAAACCTRRRR